MKRALKNLTTVAFGLALSAPVVGCTGDGGGTAGRQPFRDAWQVAVDLPFVHTNPDDGTAEIFDITVGGRLNNDNFANRGDVIVDFNGPTDRILVELRRFTLTTSSETAQDDFRNLTLWAFTSSLGRPQDQDVEDDCATSGWQNGCEIRVYFDGLSQLQRSGADIRVTLPSDYRQKINVVTEDNVADDDYFNRGNVCISNLFASADVEAQSGNIWVSLASDTTPAPKCSQDQIDACENWTVQDANMNEVPAPWASECDCIAVGGGEFGRLDIENRDDNASNITVDVPEGLWASLRAENRGDGQMSNGEFCEADITVPAVEFEPTGNDFPWQAFGNAAYPGEPAIRGAGFSVQAISNACAPVARTEDPDEFVGVGNGKEQESTEQGNVVIGTGTITASCNELIP
ncbi:MAG: hypothetical protein K0V04_19800 [Deltaproteobacteria bacterium]|nr:hypothetical protein [Deltaproteobacteria bacterium]